MILNSNEIRVFDEKYTNSDGFMYLGLMLFFGSVAGVIASISMLCNGMGLFCLYPLIPLFLLAFIIWGGLTHVSENMSEQQRAVYHRYRELRKKVPALELPKITPDVIFLMEPEDASEVKNKMDNLYNVYQENQRVTRVNDHRIVSIKSALKEDAEALVSHTKEMKKFEELR